VTVRYQGKYDAAMAWFQDDAQIRAGEYWYPVNQQYVPGSWGCGAWILAFLALVVLVGIIILAYMIVARPAGELIVTYEYRPPAVEAPQIPAGPAPADDTMACPRCAETIKKAAKVCRFCKLELEPHTPVEPDDRTTEGGSS
jgi:hypothetical protein